MIPPSRPSGRLKLLALLMGAVVLPMLLITLIEGSSSLFLLARALWEGESQGALRERRHARYDQELGWISVPDADLPDMYGPGVPLHINAQGFREPREPGPRSEPPELRVICSGDSFTFGQGVADDRTWCALLAAEYAGIQTVNMGQTGYGMDQAYLWYKRDGRRLEHEAHIFAYITDDIFRMRQRSFLGVSKPVLAIQDDSLVVQNTPVPESGTRSRWFWRAARLRHQSSTGRLLLWLGDSVLSLRGRQGSSTSEETTADSVTAELYRLIVQDLARMDRAEGSTLIMVHLPTVEDYRSDRSDRWRERLRAASAGRELVFVDLIPEFRRLPADSAQQMFIGDQFQRYLDVAGHYSVIGNQWVAEQLYRVLLGIPTLAIKLRSVKSHTRP